MALENDKKSTSWGQNNAKGWVKTFKLLSILELIYMFDEEKQIKTNVTIYHILEDGVIVTSILVSMHGNANSGKAYYELKN